MNKYFAVFVFLLLASFSISISTFTSSSPVDIDFRYSPTNPSTSESVQFEAIVNESVFPVSYTWEFGDGSHREGKGIVYHRYSEDKTYNVTLTIVGNRSRVYQCSHRIVVNNTPPSPAFTVDKEYVNPDDLVNFDASKSTDPDGNITKFSWFISGVKKTGEKISYVFPSAGKYEVVLTVVDDDGYAETSNKTITVAYNKPPDPVFTVRNSVVSTGENISFTDASSDPDGTIEKYQWSFGDGSTSTLQNPSHIYHEKGQYKVTLRVWDDDNATASYATDITVTENNSDSIPGFTTSLILFSLFASLLLISRKDR